MNKFCAVAVALVTAFSFSIASADIILNSEDFDGTTTGPGFNPSGGLSLTTVADPAGGTNMVGCVEVTGGGQWQSLIGGTTYPLPSGTVAGTDSIDVSYRIYVPSTTTAQLGNTFNTGDKFNSLFRWNGTAPDAYPPSQQDYVSSFPFDTWVTVTAGGLISATDNTDGSAVTGVQPIFSVHVPANSTPDTQTGLLAYIDDYELSVTNTPAIPEPSSLSLLGLAFGAAFARRRRIS